MVDSFLSNVFSLFQYFKVYWLSSQWLDFMHLKGLVSACKYLSLPLETMRYVHMYHYENTPSVNVIDMT